MDENQADNAAYKDAQKRRLEELQKRQAAQAQLSAITASTSAFR